MRSPKADSIHLPEGVGMRIRLVLVAATATVLAAPSSGAPRASYGLVELVRDTWGIPHAFSETDEGALYALGWATAEERGFQMTYSLRIIQGRLAEIIGPRRQGNRADTAVDNDRKMRTFGWVHAARRTAANLDPATRSLLEAYCEGVNDSFAEQQKGGRLHPLFASLGVKPEPWTQADCLLSWWHFGQYFATDGTRDLMAWRNRDQPARGGVRPPTPTDLWRDDAAAVLQRGDISDAWLRRVETFVEQHGLRQAPGGPDGPKFSHAWVVGGKRTTTGSAVLVSDPQTPVRNPSLLQEFHICGRTFNARGVGVPGSPVILIGFSRNVAWGVTALGADQADLFRLETDPAKPNQYRWDGQWRNMDVREEAISVRGADPVRITIRETHLGPIANDFAFRAVGDPDVALKRVPICDTGPETTQAAFAMMRAANVSDFAAALAGWRFPSANCVYGDARGGIGFSVIGAIPVRSASGGDRSGSYAAPGRGNADDWQGFVAGDLLPNALNPPSGVLLTANHRPIGSFYRIPLGTSTGSMGDTMRSWRLRELLSGDRKLTPADVLAVHHDTVNPARRDIVRVALHIRDTGQGGLAPEVQRALAALEPWLKAGASSDLRSPGAALATRISTFFRMMATPVAARYGGGESGLARFLKDAVARISRDPQARLDDDERGFIDQAIAQAMGDAPARGGAAAPARRQAVPAADAPPQRVMLPWFDSLDGFGSLDPSGDRTFQGITCFDGQTIGCQSSQSYTQWAPMHDPDLAMTICPVGHSDRPDSPYRETTARLWCSDELHAAPISRAAVDRIASRTWKLSR